MRRDRWASGLFFILIGVLLLLQNLGYLSWGFWWQMGRLWPLLLVALGLKLIFSRSGAASAILVLALVGIIGYAAWQGFNAEGSGPLATAEYTQELTPGVTRGGLELNFGAGELHLAGGSQGFAAGHLDYRGEPPVWEYREDGERANLRVALSGTSPADWSGGPGKPVQRWEMQLSDQPVWEITASTGACQVDMDLSTVAAESVTIRTGASAYRLRLGDRLPHCQVTIEAGASDIHLVFPAGAGVVCVYRGALGGNNLEEAGFIRRGEVYERPGYDQAGVQFSLVVSSGAGDLEVSFAGD